MRAFREPSDMGEDWCQCEMVAWIHRSPLGVWCHRILLGHWEPVGVLCLQQLFSSLEVRERLGGAGDAWGP